MENENKQTVTINNKNYLIDDLHDDAKILLDKFLLTKQEADRIALKLERYQVAADHYSNKLVEMVESKDE